MTEFQPRCDAGSDWHDHQLMLQGLKASPIGGTATVFSFVSLATILIYCENSRFFLTLSENVSHQL